MRLQEIKEIWEQVKHKEKWEHIRQGVINFDKLCEKAKCLIWEEILDPKSYLLYVWSIDDDLTSLSPIEQIMSVALTIFEYRFCSAFPISFDFNTQQEILSHGKRYIADFAINYMVMNDVEYECERPIIIECDGYDAHHTKEQRNHDIDRENNLKEKGYSIIRFTGSQIVKDPYDCVMRAYKFLLDENRSVIKQASEDMRQEQESIQKLQEER